jgi:hypothetical protein
MPPGALDKAIAVQKLEKKHENQYWTKILAEVELAQAPTHV